MNPKKPKVCADCRNLAEYLVRETPETPTRPVCGGCTLKYKGWLLVSYSAPTEQATTQPKPRPKRETPKTSLSPMEEITNAARLMLSERGTPSSPQDQEASH